MDKNKIENTWAHHLALWHDGPAEIFDESFLSQFGDRIWNCTEADGLAAHSLHIELISRIATQSLGYSTGVEKRALTSIFELFGMARTLSKQNKDCSVFETIVWHVLNSYVRPFTSKWHVKSENGKLDALDETDLFRAELEEVQNRLIALDSVLNKIRKIEGFDATSTKQHPNQFIEEELKKDVNWRPRGVERHNNEDSLSKLEEQSINERRKYYGIPNQNWASGIALSGGGIRSATFAMGVLVALSKRGLIKQFDYLSTVSGGGYTGSFLSQLLGAENLNPNLSLNEKDLPFKRSEGESNLLRRIRQGASYLSGSNVERFTLAMAQVQGIFLTVFIVLCFISFFAFADYLSRSIIPPDLLNTVALGALLILVSFFLLLPIARGLLKWSLLSQNQWVSLLSAILLVPPFWAGLGSVHELANFLLKPPNNEFNNFQLSIALIILSFLVIISAALFTKFSLNKPMIFGVISIITAILAETIIYHIFVSIGAFYASIIIIVAFIIVIALWFSLDVNSTSLHSYYRRKLADAFLIGENCIKVKPLKLSKIISSRTLFPILNCSLNVPGSIDPKMRGRHADLFSFTPISAGSDLIGHSPVTDWEAANPALDIATAMALSGAAVSPQMGQKTKRYSSFWLTILNLRLGVWLKNPRHTASKKMYPTIKNLTQELFATANENDAVVQISDGGHIENLGIYELLRRRCKFIVAVDGEHDASMTFHGFTNLQRLAYIDFGIIIESDLEDLRLDSQGFSRSHFRFCRIRYPLGTMDKQEEFGYLLYMKLSLTGNEGEFIRRYKLDEPAFPHHSTADQFFNEAQFEAYRALGEHVGDKMFLKAITGISDEGNLDIEDWFVGLADSFLDPIKNS